MLSHLVYVSTRTADCTDDQIQKILFSCRKNNAGIGITGVLLYSETNFVQYLEGDYKTIIGLYDRIKTDTRHKNVVMITSAPIQERSFPSWQMGARHFGHSAVDFKTDISEEDGVIFNSILSGKAQDNNRALSLMKKLFR
jgi:hypothetical protein